MKAMILAAGRGERMRPLTDHIPKPLLKVGGQALIVWHIKRLAKAGFKEIIINHAYLGAQIEAYLGNGQTWGVSIEYSPELEALETAGGIANALPLLGDAPFLVVNGDVYTDYDFAQIAEIVTTMQKQSLQAYLVMVDNPPQHMEGDFALAQALSNPVKLIKEEGGVKLTFSGIGIYQPQLFSHITRGSAAKLAPLLRQAMTREQVAGEHFKGMWFDIGTPARLQKLDDLLNQIA